MLYIPTYTIHFSDIIFHLLFGKKESGKENQRTFL